MADVIKVSLGESQLPTELKMRLSENHMFTWAEDHTEVFYKVIFSAITKFIKNHESRDARTGFKVVDFKNNFIFGTIVSYETKADSDEEDADENDKGSWSLEFTTNEADMADIPNMFDNMNNEYVQIYDRELWEICKGRFLGDKFKQIMLVESMNTLLDFIDKNCKDDGSSFELELEGYFTASIGVEDGVKVLSFVPGSVIKQAIKDDSVL